MLLIVLFTPSIAASAIPPCLIATIKVFSKFGALKERSYHEIIWLQILKTLREEKNAVRELRRCDERVHMFQCLVIYISLDKMPSKFSGTLNKKGSSKRREGTAFGKSFFRVNPVCLLIIQYYGEFQYIDTMVSIQSFG